MQSYPTSPSDLDFDFPLDDLNLPDPSLCHTLQLFDAGPSEPSTICDEEADQEDQEQEEGRREVGEGEPNHNALIVPHPADEAPALKKELQRMRAGLRHAAVVLARLQTTQKDMCALRKRLVGVEMENRRLGARLEGRGCCLRGAVFELGEWLDRVVEGEGEYMIWCRVCGGGGLDEFLEGLPRDLGELVVGKVAEAIVGKLMEGGGGIDRLLAVLNGGVVREDVLRLLGEVGGERKVCAVAVMVRGALMGVWGGGNALICLARLMVEEEVWDNVGDIVEMVRGLPEDDVVVRVLVPAVEAVGGRGSEEGLGDKKREGVVWRCRAALEIYLESECDDAVEECIKLAYELESRFCGAEMCYDAILNELLWSRLSSVLSNVEHFAKVLRLAGFVSASLIRCSDVVVKRGVERVVERLASMLVLHELPSQMRVGAITAVVLVAQVAEEEILRGVVQALKRWCGMQFAHDDVMFLSKQTTEFLRMWKLEPAHAMP